MKSFARFLSALLFAISFAFAQGPEPPPSKPLTLEGLFGDGGLTGRLPESVQWTSDNSKVSFIVRDDSGDHASLWVADSATGEKSELVSEARLNSLAPSAEKIKDEREKERLTRYHVDAYRWSPDGKQLMFNSLGQMWLYSLENRTAIQFTVSSDPTSDAKFSPAQDRVAYIRKHNLYVQSLSGDKVTQITKDKDEHLLNGEADWVYTEELGVRSNYFWSPNGSAILYMQTDETRVPEYPITDWLPTHPTVDMEKYPKAGDPNPTVRIGVVAAGGGRTQWISLTQEKDIYIPRFGWVNDELVWAEVLNRTQDKLDLYFADPTTGRSRVVLTETAPDAWININDDFHILESGDRFLWSSWRDGNNHLYLYGFDKQNPFSDAHLNRQLTRGDFEVLRFCAVDESAGLVYFLAAKDDPKQQHLYSVRLDGSGLRRVSHEDGTHAPEFSADGKHYVDTFSTALTPPRFSLCNTDGACQKLWDAHSLSDYALTAPQFLQFKAEDDTRLLGQLLLPKGATGKIPLIVTIYGGPAAQLVTDAWGDTEQLFNQYLAGKGYAVFTVDNRGTPGRDRKFQTAIRHQFGGVELKDQLAALDQLLAQFPQLDSGRIAIWGRSNGGSMTLYALTHSNRFKAGVSISPVTDQRNYDTIYTERYMGLPKDNGAVYADSLTKSAANLQGSLLLVHGSSDDNVHFQNSIQMADALINAHKQFRFMVYPGKTHGISGDAKIHLFHMVDEFLAEKLK